MSKFRLFIARWQPALNWLLLLLWMAVIFSASGDTQSSQHSSRLIAPLLRWLFPQMSAGSLDLVILLVRKCAHLTEYALLAVLFWRALRRPEKNGPQPWSWSHARLAVLFVMLYAGTDELHQQFVPSREGCVSDVLIDTFGGSLGIFFLRVADHRHRRRPIITARAAAAIAPRSG